METRDWIYLLGFVVTSVISGVSLYLNLLNRRNAIREHLYKEQIELYKKLLQIIGDFIEHFNQIRDWEYAPEDKVSEISKGITQLHKFTVLNSFLLPNDFQDYIRKVIDEARVTEGIVLSAGRLEDHETDALSVAASDFLQAVNNHIGTEKLSEENRQLISSASLQHIVQRVVKKRTKTSNKEEIV